MRVLLADEVQFHCLIGEASGGSRTERTAAKGRSDGTTSIADPSLLTGTTFAMGLARSSTSTLRQPPPAEDAPRGGS